MSSPLKRALAALLLAITAGGAGYKIGTGAASDTLAAPAIAEQDVAAPAAGTTRILYSLDAKHNDQELIALINAAKTHIYFAIYEFTLTDVADALVAAKSRGVDVRGLVDSGESAKSYDVPVMTELRAVGIPITTEHHHDHKGIMHIKALVTDSAYALGSYNWTASATKENDELLEVGTDPELRQAYENVIKGLIDAYSK